MIFDKLENIHRYLDSKTIEEIRKIEFNKGFNKISDKLAVIGLEYETGDEKKFLWEAHRKNIDLHIILEGNEKVYISDIINMKSTKEYEDDYELFEGDKEYEVSLRTGYFLLMYPNEVHKTCIWENESCKVKKNVFKIPLNV